MVQSKVIAQSLEKKTKTKTKQNKNNQIKKRNGNQILNQQIAKMEVVKVVKNWKVITMYLAIVTVIIEIIMEMIVMFMNKDNNK